jgi:RNA polymerase sigma-32 factor
MRHYDELASYMAVAGNHPILTHEQEIDLAERWRDRKDPKAAETLVRCNLRAVVKIAGEFRAHYQGSFADLVQEGNMGLLKAVDRYDPERGTRFLSYAGWWIRACIKEFLLRQRSLVRMGTTQKQRVVFSRLGRAKAELASRGGTPLTGRAREEALAEILGVPVTVVREMEGRLAGHDLSLEARIGDRDGDSETTFKDFVADGSDSQEVLIGRSEQADLRHNAINEALKDLNPKERIIIHRRFLTEDPETLKVIGLDLGISRERVRQLEARALKKIRRSFAEQGLNAEDLVDRSRAAHRAAA